MVPTIAARIGFRINANNTKAFSSYIPEANKTLIKSIFINSSRAEEMSDFKYFGLALIPNGQANDNSNSASS